MSDHPAVREGDDIIEIDVKKGEWPYFKLVRLDDGSVIVFIDCNVAGQVIGSGVGMAGIRLSKKKARRVAEFLERTS